MRVLLLGATGNLGLRMVPALIAHGHEITAYVRSAQKLRSLISMALAEKISIYEGDALNTTSVEAAIREHECDAIMNTAGNFVLAREQILGKIASSVSSAAIRVGRERKEPLRMWIIGGLGSLGHPDSGGWTLQDYFPRWGMKHHRETEEVMRIISVDELRWSLLCVAWMLPVSKEIDVLPAPRGHALIVKAGECPGWESSRFRWLPVVGGYLDVWFNMPAYTTELEDVADLVGEDLAKDGESEFVGQLVGMKESKNGKTE